MGASHKGYVSFILFSQLSFLLLLPFLIYHNASSQSLIGAYAADSTYREHVSFKRAISSCAAGALSDLQNGIILPELKNALAPNLPKAPLFSELLHSEQEQALRLETIRRWALLEDEWAKNTDFDAKIFCGDDAGRAVDGEFSLLQCAEKIRLSADGQAVELQPGIMAQASSRSSGASAKSELMGGRIG